MLAQIDDTPYYVDASGNTFRLWGDEFRPIKTTITRDGYRRLVMHIHGKRKLAYVHVLVARYFPIKDLSNGCSEWDKVIRFRDGKRSNCVSSNLYYADRSDKN